ncbi:hypothetical protein [Nocardia seriolae]|uniref:Uncharacterized protein n=1 Tax=Nocardia seriolae TaxID=37332 RepID=A0ABC8ATR2_9NOCA|nr:hypothetical protein [Nocardia seriolae]APA97628.1 hypothetical protein NS506_03578 [Nocardia seriolae]MTJ62511.1 hypothetical protein [Nocardia seriolae]MTJ72840.1 hypothetical protein [Nocardia seriolae]MTJ87410.1 hypothetical protein [Nocardia seriolae]MTK31401.1 hypothetical protein [Nocardia seriolae]
MHPVPGSVTDPMGEPLPDDEVGSIGFEHAQFAILGDREFSGDRLKAGDTETAWLPGGTPPSGTHGFGVRLVVDDEIYLEENELQ